jgi:alkaline phosphatase D
MNPDSRLDRRRFLTGALATASGLALASSPALARCRVPRVRASGLSGLAFDQGVASGQPTCRGITLWTKLGGLERDGTLQLEVSRDEDFRRIVTRRSVTARTARGGTVHARLTGCRLEPGERYFYRFSTRDADSPVGRFQTARPPDSREPVRIGFFSCQAYEAGYYTPHAGLLAEEDLDLVVCLGDYIYEQPFYEQVRPDTTGDQGEVQTLDEYRAKYALYHTDPLLTELRRMHPLMAIWDDHEVEDNYAADQPGAATRNPRVPFAERRAAGYRSFFEHMPRIRSRSDRDRIYGGLRLGRHVDLLLLDQRQYRDDQPCGDQIGNADCLESFDPERTMLGTTQRDWFERRLAASDATWKIVGSQVMFMALDVPAGHTLNPDQYDGYKAERERLMRFIAENAIDNVSILTGDIHTFFAGQVTPSGRQPFPGAPNDGAVATEFVGGAVTSDGVPETIGVDDVSAALVNQLDEPTIRANNPHIEYVDTNFKGYGVLEASADELLVTFRAARTIDEPASEVFDLARFRVAAGLPQVEVVAGQNVPLPNLGVT